jgi:hypothetical protein
MKNHSKQEYICAIRHRYHRSEKDEKAKILDEVTSTLNCHRKHAIRLLNCSVKLTSRIKRGRPALYHKKNIVDFVREVYRMSNCICSRRLKHSLPLFLPYTSLALGDEERDLIQHISHATIDRILEQHRSKFGKLGLATTKPGTLLKKQIPVKTGQWDESRPGYVETDSVAHCGNNVSGAFVYTVNMVDIATGWTIQRAIWGKGQRSCFEALRSMEQTLPFRLLGFDCDNGGEFLNHHLREYFCERKNPIEYTRSRPYKKNDNAHIEQKNWTNVRQILGYMRFDRPEIVDMMNDLYTNELYLYNNYFITSFKLIDKYRDGARIIKKHDSPKTPFDRLIASGSVPVYKQRLLKKQLASLNPYVLHKLIVSKVNRILNCATGNQ